MTWSQIYDPLNFWQLSTFVSSLPVLTLFFVLLVLKQRVWIAALSGMIMAVVLASTVFGMPASLISNATFLGVVFGLGADCVDHRRLHFPLPHCRRNRTVSGDEGIDCCAVLRFAPASYSHCILLWSFPGRHRRRWSPCGDRRSLSHRPGVPAIPGCGTLPGCQHRSGGLGRGRESHSCPGRSHRTSGTVSECHDGPYSPAVFTNPAAVAGAQHGGLEEDVRGVPGAAGLRAVVCRDAILLVEFSRDRTRGYCLGHFLATGHGGLSALLEAQECFGTTPGKRKGRTSASFPGSDS